MNHLLRAHAPISDAGWELLDQEARERLAPALAARKLVDFSGPHGWEHSATNLGRISAAGHQRRASGCPAASVASCRSSSCGRTSTSPAGRAPRRRSRRRRRRPRAARRRRAPDRGGRERRRLPRLAGRDQRHRRGLAARADTSSARPPTATRSRSPARSSGCSSSGIAGPYGLALGREQYRLRDRDRRARRLPAARAPAQDPRRPDRLGAGRQRSGRAQPARRRLHVRVRPGPRRSATTRTTARSCGSISRRASASTSPRRRPRWR